MGALNTAPQRKHSSYQSAWTITLHLSLSNLPHQPHSPAQSPLCCLCRWSFWSASSLRCGRRCWPARSCCNLAVQQCCSRPAPASASGMDHGHEVSQFVMLKGRQQYNKQIKRWLKIKENEIFLQGCACLSVQEPDQDPHHFSKWLLRRLVMWVRWRGNHGGDGGAAAGGSRLGSRGHDWGGGNLNGNSLAVW